MEEKYAETIVPPWWKGVTRNHRGVAQNVKVYGLDTETVDGMVYASGLSSDTEFKYCYGLQRDHVSWVINTVLHGKHDKQVVVFAHFLNFDLSVLFFRLLYDGFNHGPAPKTSKFCHLKTRTEVEILWSRPTFAVLRKGHTHIYIIDTFAFFTMSLDKALASVQADFKKLPKPKGLGKVMLKKDEVVPYLKQDCRGAQYLGEVIVGWCKKWDVRLCVSAPQLAGRIFRHKFVEHDFVNLSPAVMEGSMLSYHGGKNRFSAKAGWYENVYELDINSAYPEAMLQLPCFYEGTYEPVKDYRGPMGVYCVSGRLQPCPYGSLHSHSFKPLAGPIKDVWVTGWELEEAIRSKEFEPHSIWGYVFMPTSEKPSPFVAYVKHWYDVKREATKGSAEYNFAKLMLNSLYGKFIQRITNEERERVAGSMFYPFIATMITGYVNAKMHRYEHKYQALHTATDSIKTQRQPDPADIGEDVGQWKQEILGPCLLLRNKLYVHFAGNGESRKVGMHGFQGTPEELIAMYRSGKFEYVRRRLRRWAESWHVGKQPGEEIIRKMDLFIDKAKRDAKRAVNL